MRPWRNSQLGVLMDGHIRWCIYLLGISRALLPYLRAGTILLLSEVTSDSKS